MVRAISIVLSVFLSASVISQTYMEPDIIIHYPKYKSIVLFGNIKSDMNIDSTEHSQINNVDSLLKYYDIRPAFYVDSTGFADYPYHSTLDSTGFSTLLKKGDLTLNVVQYGYGGGRNYDELTAKYGVKYYSGGCVYSPSDVETEYTEYLYSLLFIRNGPDWQKHYSNDIPKEPKTAKKRRK